MRIKRKSCGLLYGILLSFLLLLNCSGSKDQTGPENILSLTNGWQYRLGDSPTDSTGHLLWLDIDIDTALWTPINRFNEIPTHKQSNSLWLRTQLPDCHCLSPGLFIGQVSQSMQVFLDNVLIYQFGEFASIDTDHFMGWQHHLIPLPANYIDRTLSIRIWSSGSDIGLEAPILLGPTHQIQSDMLKDDIDNIIIGSLILFFSLVFTLLFILFRRDTLFTKIALYLSAIGLFILNNTSLLFSMTNAPYLIFILDTLSMQTIAIAGYLTLEHIMVKKYKTIIRRFWQIHFIYLIITIIVLLSSGTIYIFKTLDFFIFMSSILMLICAFIIIKIRKLVSDEIKILLGGIVILYGSILIEMILFYNIVIKSGHTFDLTWLPYGALIFSASLVWLIIYRYIQTSKQKIKAQKENLEYIIENEKLNNEMIREKLESEKWQELDKFKSRFLANISHEFRTPLTLILGSARQLIAENHNDVVTERSRLQEKSGNRLLQQINQLLDLSKLDAGKISLHIEEKDIIPLIKGIFHSFESYAEQQKIKMILDIKVEPAIICHDKEKMETILSNLISNAIKFTPANGQVKATVFQNNYFEIQISDSGLGIPHEHLPYIFDRFYQADYNDQKGTGIGLALTCELIKLHDGEIIVESELNKGSTFTVKLPLRRPYLKEENSIAAKETPTSILPQGRKLESRNSLAFEPSEKISEKSRQSFIPPQGETKGGVKRSPTHETQPILLIIEDNTDLRKYIRDILSDTYQIQEAANGEEGFIKAAELIPDLIISDVMMPQMDGYKCCEKLKTDERTSHIPVILLTARAGMESKLKGLEQGADDYLIKPFQASELRIRIKNLIQQRQKLRQRFSNEITLPIKEITTTSVDAQFIERAIGVIESRLDDADMNIEWFCKEIGLSRSQVHRKFQALTNQSISEFIRSVRLKHAVQLLKSKSATVSEIAWQTGFSSPEYFRSCFKKQFGCSPSDYRKKSVN